MSPTEQIKNAISNIRVIRQSKNISGKAIYQACGLPRATTVNDWEDDRGFPTLAQLIAISDFLEVRVDDLLKGRAIVIFAKP